MAADPEDCRIEPKQRHDHLLRQVRPVIPARQVGRFVQQNLVKLHCLQLLRQFCRYQNNRIRKTEGDRNRDVTRAKQSHWPSDSACPDQSAKTLLNGFVRLDGSAFQFPQMQTGSHEPSEQQRAHQHPSPNEQNSPVPSDREHLEASRDLKRSRGHARLTETLDPCFWLRLDVQLIDCACLDQTRRGHYKADRRRFCRLDMAGSPVVEHVSHAQAGQCHNRKQ